jgi:hypothetical protein
MCVTFCPLGVLLDLPALRGKRFCGTPSRSLQQKHCPESGRLLSARDEVVGSSIPRQPHAALCQFFTTVAFVSGLQHAVLCSAGSDDLGEIAHPSYLSGREKMNSRPSPLRQVIAVESAKIRPRLEPNLRPATEALSAVHLELSHRSCISESWYEVQTQIVGYFSKPQLT